VSSVTLYKKKKHLPFLSPFLRYAVMLSTIPSLEGVALIPALNSQSPEIYDLEV
jgi:hypothetical protein